MKYLYDDLGEHRQDCVVAHRRGSLVNVILLDQLNFDRYRAGLPFEYTGGLHTLTPARFRIPQDGHWYVVIDCGGYQHHVRAKKIEILAPGKSTTASEPDTTLVGADS